MDDLSDFVRKKQFSLKERGTRKSFMGEPIGGNSNPGASIADVYDRHFIENDDIPPQHNLHKLDFIRILRKKKIKPKQKIRRTKSKNKRCKCGKMG